jgi:NitT/TauT family transport system substrate-binding protein
MRRSAFTWMSVVLVTLSIVTGCGSNGNAKGLTTVKVAMGYIPNVQFAPFYVAVRRGYYRHAGLNVHFNYTEETDGLAQLAHGDTDFVDAGGDEVMTAAAHGLPVKYVMTQYTRFPSALFFIKGRGIKTVADLRGKTIGVPQAAGVSYYGLLTLLQENEMTPQDVHIEVVGYNQVSAVATGKVDAAMGYANNEPLELRREGKPVGQFDVYRWANIAGAGLATSDAMISKHRAVVRRFVNATIRGMRFVLAHPSEAFKESVGSIPGITELGLQRQILRASLLLWRPLNGMKLGEASPTVWSKTESILSRYGGLGTSKEPSRFYTNAFIP